MVWRLLGTIFIFVISSCATNSSGGSAERLPTTTIATTTQTTVEVAVSTSATRPVGVLDNNPEKVAEEFMRFQLEAFANPSAKLDIERLGEITTEELSAEVVSNLARFVDSGVVYEDANGPNLFISRVNLPVILGDPATFTGYQPGEIATVEMCWDDDSAEKDLTSEVLIQTNETKGVLVTLLVSNGAWRVLAVDYQSSEVLENCI